MAKSRKLVDVMWKWITKYHRKTVELCGFNDLPITLIGIPLVAFMMPLLFFGGTLEFGLLAYWPKWKVSLFFTTFYWIGIRTAILFYRNRFPEYRDTGKRITYLVLTTMVVIISLNTFCYDIHGFLVDESHRFELHKVSKFDYAKSTFLVALLITAIYEGIYFYTRWRLSLIEAERLRQENLISQMEGLKSQVNPHFLFNSLNTLTYLIPEDNDRAVRFVQQLSKVYRYVLEIRDRSLITVAEELEFLDAYLFLLRERFGDNLQVDLQIDPAVRVLHMVPLSLQLLFENAIKHNIISREHPLFIKVIAVSKEEGLVVENNLQLKQQEQISTRVGLENIKSRYAFYTNQKVEVINNGQKFSVRIPLLYNPELVKQQSLIS